MTSPRAPQYDDWDLTLGPARRYPHRTRVDSGIHELTEGVYLLKFAIALVWKPKRQGNGDWERWQDGAVVLYPWVKWAGYKTRHLEIVGCPKPQLMPAVQWVRLVGQGQCRPLHSLYDRENRESAMNTVEVVRRKRRTA